mmetsp:Transcript_52960/g.118817  ORF Transcript_52960/g.118817 Transcript_52960/m.118817 type:complete len:259 (+) Transcript_52960:135-911(+)
MPQHQIDANDVAPASFAAQPANARCNVHHPNGTTIVGIENVRKPPMVKWIYVQIMQRLLGLRVVYDLINRFTWHLCSNDCVEVLSESLPRICAGRFQHNAPDQRCYPCIQQSFVLQPLSLLCSRYGSRSFDGTLHERGADYVEKDDCHHKREKGVEHAHGRTVFDCHMLEDRNTSLGVAVPKTAAKRGKQSSRYAVKQLVDVFLDFTPQRLSENQRNHIQDQAEQKKGPNQSVHPRDNPMYQFGQVLKSIRLRHPDQA